MDGRWNPLLGRHRLWVRLFISVYYRHARFYLIRTSIRVYTPAILYHRKASYHQIN